MIPISLKLKRRMHKEIAYAQDIGVEELYRFFPEAVIHGGTAIWRCYGGNRFSDDIDIYIKRDKERLERFFDSLEKKGFQILKKRIKENALYSALKFNRTIIRFEALFKDVKNFVLKEYETSEGLFINVYTLTPEDLVMEKVDAYLSSRKIRDLYDIFFLLRYVKDKKVMTALKKLIRNYKSPVDEQDIKTIVISGLVPTSEKILEYIRRWAR